MEKTKLYLGIDVGTGSVRAGLFDVYGNLVREAQHSIQIFQPAENYYEQSSDDIWEACCSVSKDVTRNISVADVRGVGFDATCSLVVLDKFYQPLSISYSGKMEHNVVMWMDHRAEKQAKAINDTHHPVLRFVGDTISLEMQTPKLCWLKENMFDKCWLKAHHFFDLPDFLTWKATGDLSRSLCSVVCKWTYQAGGEDQGWSDDYFRKIGLKDIVQDGYSKIGTKFRSPGSACGQGLSAAAAQQLGLLPGTPVGTSIIDAHAGGLGTLGCQPESPLPETDVTSHLALICGTSTCHMAVNENAIFVQGVWGPYYSAMIPGLWLTEGGQSATGKLVDDIISTHPAYGDVKEKSKVQNVHIHNYLNDVLVKLAEESKVDDVALLTTDLHVWPDFHGNRSPLSDPTLRGMVCGLGMGSTVTDLSLLYLATIQALAYGTRHIIESMESSGHRLTRLCACGGLSKNPLFVQTHADVTNLPLLLPKVQESVLLGAAMLGACASGDVLSLQDAMKKLGGKAAVVHPHCKLVDYHTRKYDVFLKMVEDQRQYKQIMANSS